MFIKTVKLFKELSDKFVKFKKNFKAFISWFKFFCEDCMQIFNTMFDFKLFYKVLYCCLNFDDINKNLSFLYFFILLVSSFTTLIDHIKVLNCYFTVRFQHNKLLYILNLSFYGLNEVV